MARITLTGEELEILRFVLEEWDELNQDEEHYCKVLGSGLADAWRKIADAHEKECKKGCEHIPEDLRKRYKVIETAGTHLY